MIRNSVLFKILTFICRPLSPFYGWIMSLRSLMYSRGILKQHRLPVKVISVGNLTMGGAGKTPVVMYLADLLKKTGRKPAVVSRGYRGKAVGRYNIVSDGRQILMEAADCGDEPRMLAENLPETPVLIGAKRAVVGQYAADNLDIDTIILDDGFQHLAVKRDLDLVVFSARALPDPFRVESLRVIPGGELREPLSALTRAHGFIITGLTDETADRADALRKYLTGRFSGRPVFFGRYLPDYDSQPALEQIKQDPVYAFCGIADPESFQQLLIREGFKVAGFRAFHDHAAYTTGDVQALRENAGIADARTLITTEKDLVKLKAYQDGGLPIMALKIKLVIEEKFDRFISELLRHQG